MWVKKVSGPDDKLQKIICVSETKAAKEQAIISKKEQRFVTDLERLRASVEKGTIKKANTLSMKELAV